MWLGLYCLQMESYPSVNNNIQLLWLSPGSGDHDTPCGRHGDFPLSQDMDIHTAEDHEIRREATLGLGETLVYPSASSQERETTR